MQPFAFIQVQDNAAALQAIGESGDSRFIGGGTNLIDLMKLGIENPQRLVDINPLPSQKIESLPGGGMRIGALVRNSDLAYDAIVRKQYPVLSEALLSGASAQLRNMATVGGNLMQRTRCPYFYDTAFECNKRRPGSGCAALQGYNRSHAILGTSDKCIATHPSDMCVALSALEALIQIVGPHGQRTVPIGEFHLLPGQTPQYETALKSGELIVSVEIPATPFAVRSHYLKVRDRASYEFALASAAVALEIEQGMVKTARIALGGVGTKPWRALSAEKLLIGKSAAQNSYELAAVEALREAIPSRHNEFKLDLAKRTLMRALNVVGGMA